MQIETLSLRDAIVFLIAAGVVVPLARRIKVSPVLGFLIVGLGIGPHGIARFADAWPWLGYATIADQAGVKALAELGIVFLLFMIGLELSLDRLWMMRRLVFGLGGAQVLVCGAVIALIAGLFENTLATAVVVGAALALSSTAIVVQLLSENLRLGTATGRTSFSILLCQDLAVLPILFLIGIFAASDAESIFLAFGQAMGQALVSIAVILAVGRLVIRPLFRFIGAAATREMFLALVLLTIFGTALATHRVGLSMALGAFLAGLLIAETEYRHEIEVDIEPFKGLLLGLFFVSVGMSIDITRFFDRPGWLIASVAGLFAIKGTVIYLLARLFGEPRSVALEAGLLLGQSGEFAFVIIGMAAGFGLVPAGTAQFMLILAGLTMLMTPLVAHLARRLARAVEIREATDGQTHADFSTDLAGHVIVVGYGRVGRMLGEMLEAQRQAHIGLEIDADLVKRYRAVGASVFYGDASRPDLLRKFGVEQAVALVVTMDSPDIAERVVSTAHRNWPHLTIFARAHDRAHAVRLRARGASQVIQETTEASLQLSEKVLTGVGVPNEAARHAIEARRQLELANDDSHSPDEGR